LPQASDGLGIPRIYHQMKAPKPFDGHNLTGAQRIGGAAQGVIAPGDGRPLTLDRGLWFAGG
jgi:hypothetical protein